LNFKLPNHRAEWILILRLPPEQPLETAVTIEAEKMYAHLLFFNHKSI